MTIPMPSNFTRRRLLGAGLATTTALALPLPAMALNDATARALIDKVVAEINRVIASGKSLGGMIQDFESIFARDADVNIIAQSTLGADSRRASAAQMRAFTDAFRGYIARKYGKQFRQFVGGRIEVQGVRQVKSWHEVISTVYLRGEAPFEMSLLVSDRSGSDKFYNLFIEGVNLLLTERTEIGALLDRNGGNVNKLITALEGMS